MSSTELFDAASNSKILYEKSSIGLSLLNLLISFAKILAQVVFPTPLGPQNKYD